MPKRVDGNQVEIVAALRQIGASVQHLYVVGFGCPDLLVGFCGMSFLLEVKQAGEKLNGAEKRWHNDWAGGPLGVVHTAEEAINLVMGGHE
jgi:hypothetical protein